MLTRAAAAFLLLSTFTFAATAKYTFTQIDYPESTDTQVYGINDSGVVVGTYSSGTHGFSYDPGTQIFTAIDVPNALWTKAFGINNSGDIVGEFYDGAQGVYSHGFILSQGVFTTVDYKAGGALYTRVTGINNFGVMSGQWDDNFFNHQGFIYSAGIFTNLQYPGAVSTPMWGINDAGFVGGASCDVNFCKPLIWNQGFRLISAGNNTNQLVTAVSTGYTLAGYFLSGSSVWTGFVRAGTQSLVSYRAPSNTWVFGLNASQTVAGYFQDKAGVKHGFYAVKQ